MQFSIFNLIQKLILVDQKSKLMDIYLNAHI